ncbi:zinc finger protein Eos isoform X1 [Hypomesus transpacificus]|uniref:zinc finger protein Eos isoform X1 n=1 Tax=Hypomesus transpacificus TaxID=137520 RepID=UPI001F07CB3B|nr:zinc finger protein Eos isoform X1 [Hypomesus transpacificus]
MNAADHRNGAPYVSGGTVDPATEWDFYGGDGALSESTSNSQRSSPNCFITASFSGTSTSVNTELYSGQSSGASPPERGEVREGDLLKDREGSVAGASAAWRGKQRGTSEGAPASLKASSPGPVRLPNGKLQCDVCGMLCHGPNVLTVHKRSHTGERPFQCEECGAAFTQKGNLLRHTKLHSGEKPFKCPHCNYACRRRDALAGHLRTHAGCSTTGKHLKCSNCGRSYTQQSALEEHRGRCQRGLHSLENPAALSGHTAQGKQSKSLGSMTEPELQSSTEILPLIDHLANSITKRKSSTPQKFLGGKHLWLAMQDSRFEFPPGTKEGDRYSLHPGRDLARLVGMVSRHPTGSKVPAEDQNSAKLEEPQPSCLPELVSVRPVSSYKAPDGPRAFNCGGGGASAGWEADEGLSQGCHASTNTDSTAEEQNAVSARVQSNNPPTATLPSLRASFRASLSHDLKGKRRPGVTPAARRGPDLALSSREEVQVVDGKGGILCTFRCEHCHILFLDHVMFTLHMGCHGFRQPFECNVCGHRSRDRYEFTSHIVRGEHVLRRGTHPKTGSP